MSFMIGVPAPPALGEQDFIDPTLSGNIIVADGSNLSFTDVAITMSSSSIDLSNVTITGLPTQPMTSLTLAASPNNPGITRTIWANQLDNLRYGDTSSIATVPSPTLANNIAVFSSVNGTLFASSIGVVATHDGRFEVAEVVAADVIAGLFTSQAYAVTASPSGNPGSIWHDTNTGRLMFGTNQIAYSSDTFVEGKNSDNESLKEHGKSSPFSRATKQDDAENVVSNGPISKKRIVTKTESYHHGCGEVDYGDLLFPKLCYRIYRDTLKVYFKSTWNFTPSPGSPNNNAVGIFFDDSELSKWLPCDGSGLRVPCIISIRQTIAGITTDTLNPAIFTITSGGMLCGKKCAIVIYFNPPTVASVISIDSSFEIFNPDN